MARTFICFALFWGLTAVIHPNSSGAQDRFTIHEWGTFTVLQDEMGRALPGVNVNEETLPKFVHRLGSRLNLESFAISPLTNPKAKGIEASYAPATLRMETPVIYIYPPQSDQQTSIDVEVQFRGGWISEWYPSATVAAPGFQGNGRNIGKMTEETVGSIQWQQLQVGVESELPSTEEHVWLAPRKVSAARLQAQSGETETYLFYRGVANIAAPLSITRETETDQLSVSLNKLATAGLHGDQTFESLWLVDIRRDGQVAFREVQANNEAAQLAQLPGTFSADDYSAANARTLKESMRKSLVGAGLYDDEADAMLKTWELSYFKSGGMRLFFVLPRSWTDHVLPLKTNREADVERVMMGRIELVTPAQRGLIQTIAEGPVSNQDWFWKGWQSLPEDKQTTIWRALQSGEQTLAEAGFDVPADYQAFLALGRFRQALVLDELQRYQQSNMKADLIANLKQFVNAYGLSFAEMATGLSGDKSKEFNTSGSLR